MASAARDERFDEGARLVWRRGRGFKGGRTRGEYCEKTEPREALVSHTRAPMLRHPSTLLAVPRAAP